MDVKKLRKELDLTQNELAEKIGVTLRTVQNWEHGRPIPPAMQKLLEQMNESINAGDNSIVQTNIQGDNNVCNGDKSTTERIVAVLERQQDVISRQLEEITEMRKLHDRLVGIIERGK